MLEVDCEVYTFDCSIIYFFDCESYEIKAIKNFKGCTSERLRVIRFVQCCHLDPLAFCIKEVYVTIWLISVTIMIRYIDISDRFIKLESTTFITLLSSVDCLPAKFPLPSHYQHIESFSLELKFVET